MKAAVPRRVRPHARSTKKDGQLSLTVLTCFGWAVRGSACFAGARCGALRPARCAGKCSRISSASRPDGFDPMRGQQKSDQPKPVALQCFGGPSGGQPAAQAAAAAPRRLARCAGKRLRVSSAPRPFGFDPMRGQQKSDQPEPVALTIFGWAVRGSNPGPWD